MAWARGNYVANNGIGPMTETTTIDTNSRPQGVFMLQSKNRFADITDGTTNTVFLSELLKSPGNDWRGDALSGRLALSPQSDAEQHGA